MNDNFRTMVTRQIKEEAVYASIEENSMEASDPWDWKGLFYNSSNTLINDGQFKSSPIIHNMFGGQRVRVAVTNLNIVQSATITITEKRTCVEGSFWGFDKQVDCGQSYSAYLFRGETKVFDFYRFDYSPMPWKFEISNGNWFEAVNVKIDFYSTWKSGMPYDSGHPKSK
jgi:hypothetical protein